ncbi:MAG: hypothetical protein AAGJ35_11300, partial [Myxococcota bacterium]
KFRFIRSFCHFSNSRFWFHSMLCIILLGLGGIIPWLKRQKPSLQKSLWIGSITLFATQFFYYLLIFTGFHRVEIFPFLRTLGVWIGLVLLIVCAFRFLPSLRLVTFVVCFGLFCVFVQTEREALRTSAHANCHTLHRTSRYYVAALPFLNPYHHRFNIAVTGGAKNGKDNQLLLPLMGEHLQNRLFFVPTSDDGTFFKHSPNYFRAALHRANFLKWKQRLKARNIELIVSFFPKTPELQFMHIDAHSFRFLVGRRNAWGLFQRLRKSSPPKVRTSPRPKP